MLKNIKGKTPSERFKSVDNIIESLKKKQSLIAGVIKEKKGNPFNLSGFAPTCENGDVIGAHFAIIEYEVKKAVIILDECAEDNVVHAILNIITEAGIKNSKKVKLIKGLNCYDYKENICPGDRFYVTIHWTKESPKGIWVSVRGEQE